MIFVQGVRFGVVGVIGSVINISIFYLMVTQLDLNFNVGTFVSFIVAVTHNYSVNRFWTFRVPKEKIVSYFNGWVRYIVANSVGFCVNFIVLNLIVSNFGKNYIFHGQISGILCGMIINFLAAKFWVFRSRMSNQ